MKTFKIVAKEFGVTSTHIVQAESDDQAISKFRKEHPMAIPLQVYCERSL